jgi:hypothetical protein|tara:strand:+ start:5429 stop:6490 length:1062 start_codon:yes stop_codon:yes gene_type:complete
MKYHVVYEEGTVNYFGSNVSKHKFYNNDVDFLLNQPNTNIVTWELNDLELTKHFVDLHRQRMLSVIEAGPHNYFEYIYDVYRSLDEKSMLESRVEMNTIIDRINTNYNGYYWFTLPEELKLNTQDINDTRIKNLNELHDHFETRMAELNKQTSFSHEDRDRKEIVWNDLQAINLLVHFNERNVANDSNMANRQTYFTSLKFEPPYDTKQHAILVNEDYKDFTMVRGYGALTLDFGTVGKDLFTCSVTDDIELVHKNMVSQQTELNPWVQFDWFSCTEAEWQEQMELYNAWINENKVGDYLELANPMYTPGRHQLGECISHSFVHPEEFVQTIIKQTPKINSFFITDDNNKTIL